METTQEETATKPFGRPRKYNPEFCNLVRIIRSQGYSLSALRSHLGISKDTFYRWKKEYPDFGAAVDIAEDDSVFHFERIGKEIIEGEREANSTQVAVWKEERARQHGSVQGTEGKTEINIGNMNVLQQLSNEELQKKLETKLKNLQLIPTNE